MPSVEIIDSGKGKTGTFELDPRFFGVEVRRGLLHEALLVQLAGERQGAASTKTRGEVRGGGKKPYRQKGTGNARAGSIRSPIWRGGGITFGPRPKSYSLRIPKKKARAALFAALSSKVQEGTLIVVEDLSISEAKTKALATLLGGLGLKGKTLILMENPSAEIERAGQNLASVTVQSLQRINVYDLLRHDHILIRRPDLERLQQSFISRSERESS